MRQVKSWRYQGRVKFSFGQGEFESRFYLKNIRIVEQNINYHDQQPWKSIFESGVTRIKPKKIHSPSKKKFHLPPDKIGP